MGVEFIDGLRRAGDCGNGGCHPRICVCDLCNDAANDIERLIAAMTQIKAVCDDNYSASNDSTSLALRFVRNIADKFAESKKVLIDADTLETILQMNGAGLSLTGDLVCDVRRALGETPNKNAVR